MPRYTLRVPEPGTVLYGDDGPGVVADTIAEARDVFRNEVDEERWLYLHSYIGRCRVVYARDVENGDCHEDAEAGDTTIDYTRDNGRELGPNEVRVWMQGPPPRSWRMEPMPQEIVEPETIPVGAPVHHRRLGSGRVAGPAFHGYGSRRWRIPVTFGWPPGEPQRHLNVTIGSISIMPTRTWPPRLVRLTVEGEVLAEGVGEAAARTLLDARLSRLDAEWEAEQFALYEASEAAVA